MDANLMQRAAVLGAGTMGHGIAHVLAMVGFDTRLYDVAESAVEKGLGAVRANLEKGVEKGKVNAADRDAALSRLSGTAKFEQAIDGVDVVIEAVPEKLELKQQIFESLGRRLGAHVLLATNTSSLSITWKWDGALARLPSSQSLLIRRLLRDYFSLRLFLTRT